MRTILIGLPLVLLALPASAASFDCTKAQTAVEHLVCDNPELSRNDEILAKAYATALGGLSADARASLQQSQRAWIDYAPRSCSADAEIPENFTDDQAQCMVSAYWTRITELEASRMLKGWRFYPSEQAAVLDDPDPEWWGGVATKRYASPRIDDTSDVAQAFNAAMDEADSGLGKMFDASGKLTDDDVTSDSDIEVSVSDVTTHRISMIVNSSWMGHGAAHGNYGITYLHYLIDEQRPLEAIDLFTGKSWKKALGDLVLAELDRTVDGGIWDEARDQVPDLAADPARWNFSDAGLVVQFEPYEVTAYAMGAPTVTIPWSALSANLTADYDSRLVW